MANHNKKLLTPAQLEIVSVFSQELHVGRTAARLNIAQPQLSAAMKRIEESVGAPLFVRRPRGRLTPAGSVVAELAQRTLTNLAAGMEAARAAAAGKVGSVRFGFTSAAMLTDLPQLLHGFRAEHPLVELQLLELTSADLAERLRRGEIDLVVSRDPVDSPGVRVERFRHDDIRLIVPDGHPALASRRHRLADLQSEKFIFFRRAVAPRYFDRIIGACHKAGLSPQIVQEVDTWMATLALVRAGFGITLGTAVSASAGFPGVAVCRIADDMPDVSFWISSAPDRLGPAAAAMLRKLQGVAG
jgi:DNA-binding transcriptional LysR family regulator